jgi:hypothetical protein
MSTVKQQLQMAQHQSLAAVTTIRNSLYQSKTAEHLSTSQVMRIGFLGFSHLL